MKVLVLTAEPISADVLRDALGDDATQEAEVLVVSPALQDSPLRFWVSDADDAIARAEDVWTETVERLEEEGIDAAGDTGEADPLLAVQDALAGFGAERIVIVTHPTGEKAMFEDDVVEKARERFDVPVEHREVGRG
jgi:hypothetical protein